MGVIKPTLTLTSNASTASTDAGPLSVALSLSATDSLAVTEVTSKIMTVTTADDQVLWDDAAFTDGTETAGTDGGFVYCKNTHATANIFIGHAAAAALEGDGTAARLMTLKPGEFAWFPWDFTADLVVDASASATLETWVFTRTQ
tara:strand:+ start:50 stop:484 length:435 start_codon:yes stop_codon:yes gene_type:complete